MSISKIAGQMLQGNLERDGNSLAFVNNANSTPTLFLDVANSNVGINTATPGSALDIVGNLSVDSINSHTANGNITIAATTTGNVNVSTNVSVVGNVTANNFIGNISGNITSNNISVTGNVTANNFIGGTFIGKVPGVSNTIYVATNGNDSNDGGFNTPFLTIKAAMARAAIEGNVSVHVSSGEYYEDNPVTIPPYVALMGDNLRTVFVYPNTPTEDLFYMSSGCYVWGITIRNYLANGFAFNPAISNQNIYVSPYIQNITSKTTTGTAVRIDGALSSQYSTKAMIVGFFTIINEGGVGIYLTNQAYSQLVNIYTIATDIGVYADNGSFCTLNGSDNSIGNYGLVARGTGPLQTSGTLVSTFQGNFTITNLSNGQPHVNTVMLIDGDPQFYTIDTIVPIDAITSDVLVQQIYIGTATPGTNIQFFVRSAIIASAHTFEYVGAGTNPATALPQYGGIPDETKEVVYTDGGVVTFTSTDQKGTFKVGLGFAINQATGTITGIDFYRSLFAQMTPFILALSEG